jgi:hypothetical protein
LTAGGDRHGPLAVVALLGRVGAEGGVDRGVDVGDRDRVGHDLQTEVGGGAHRPDS